MQMKNIKSKMGSKHKKPQVKTRNRSKRKQTHDLKGFNAHSIARLIPALVSNFLPPYISFKMGEKTVGADEVEKYGQGMHLLGIR